MSRDLRRQQVAGIHREHLSDLHRRATQLRKLVGDAAGIGGGEQQITEAGAFALGKLARAFGQHVAGDARREDSEPAQPRPAIAGDRRGARVAVDGVVVGHFG